MQSRFSLVLRAVFRLLTLAGLTAASAAPARAAELPRYKLKPGMELVYRAADEPKDVNENGSMSSPQYTFDWTIDVTRPTDSGGWRLLVREKMSSVYMLTCKESRNSRESQSYIDIDAEGRMIENLSVQYQNPAMQLFLPLPKDDAALQSGWQSHVNLDDTTRSVTAPEKGALEVTSNWHFVEKPQGALDAIYLSTTERHYTFNASQGLVTKCVATYTQGWPERRKGNKTVRTAELVEVRELPAEELAVLAGESDRYFAVCQESDVLYSRAQREFTHTAELLDQAEAKLHELDGKLTVEALKNSLAMKLKSLADSGKYVIKAAEKFGKLLNQPSPDWETTDLDGNQRKLADYRGKVVLLDFWYRGCGWCIRAMPQIKQLAADFDGQPVVILGMNNDRVLNDARFVIETMKLPYENLKNAASEESRREGIHSKYEITGWPTLVMLDGQGVIRHIHVGYSATLREDLGAKIHALLAEAGGQAGGARPEAGEKNDEASAESR